MPVNHQAIAAVKFGNRRLTSLSFLASLNARGRDPDYSNFNSVFASDPQTIQLVASINDKLNAIWAALGQSSLASQLGDNLAFSFEGPDYSIPQSVWTGVVDVPASAGTNPAQDRQQLVLAKQNYRRACGDFRKHYAVAYDIFGVKNDVSNEDQKPNKGGVAGRTRSRAQGA